MAWAVPPVDREQLALFPTSLNDVIPDDHLVRVVDEILRALDWSKFEAAYDGHLGAKPIHPRVLAAVILYGHLTRVRSSRQLEAALWVRVDFRWLAEGWQIDHSTLSNFRKDFAELLQGVNVQFGLLAFQMQVTTLTQFGFDGTRLRASNARQRVVAVGQLDEIERKLQQKFAELEQQVAAADELDEEQLGGASLHRVSKKLASTKQRLAAVRRAQAEIDRVKAAGEVVPNRIPLTDPESRITPNKEGGFAPNYTPLANVDLESGLILAHDVIQNTDEEQHLIASVTAVEAGFAEAGFEQHVESLTADGLSVTGPNLAALAARGTTFYGPIAPQPECVNRADGRTPIPAEQWPELPTTLLKKGTNGQPDQRQFAKEAFLYDAAANCYWCPLGQALSYTSTTSELLAATQRRVERQRYAAEDSACASCPLRAKCLKGEGTHRTLSRDQYEPHREALRTRLTLPESKTHMTTRQSEGERPFAVVKQHCGVRQLLLRGLDKAKKEWSWAVSSANLLVLVRWRRTRADHPLRRLKTMSPNLGGRASPVLVGT